MRSTGTRGVSDITGLPRCPSTTVGASVGAAFLAGDPAVRGGYDEVHALAARQQQSSRTPTEEPT